MGGVGGKGRGSHSTPGSRDPSVQGRGGARPRGHAGRRDPGNSTRVTGPTKSRRTPTTTTPAFPLNGSLTLSREITPSLRFSYKNLPRPMILQSFYRPSISMLCFFFRSALAWAFLLAYALLVYAFSFLLVTYGTKQVSIDL